MNKCCELSLEHAGGKSFSFDDFKSVQVQNENIKEDGKKAEENTLAFLPLLLLLLQDNYTLWFLYLLLCSSITSYMYKLGGGGAYMDMRHEQRMLISMNDNNNTITIKYAEIVIGHIVRTDM